MGAARRIIALSVDADQRRALIEIARSRTEPANRVERAGIILAYVDEPSAYVVARAMRVSQQTVTRCLQRAAELGYWRLWTTAPAPAVRQRSRQRPKRGLSGWPAPADAIRLPARAVDDPSAGGARPQPRTGCRPLEP